MTEPVDSRKVILTFTCSQWYNMPDAMLRMAEAVHPEGMPVTWQLNLESAKAQKATLDDFHERYGDNITYFQDMLDELIANTPWNERVYCCIHEEADGPFIFPGQEYSNEGATPEQSEAMYTMIGAWMRCAKERGVTVMTLPQAIADYKATAGKQSMSSTLLTHDKHQGRYRAHVAPFPEGSQAGELAPAGTFPRHAVLF